VHADTALLVALAVLVVALVAVLVVAVVFLVRLIRLSAVVRDPRMPIEGKIAFWVAAVYAVFPIDILPDPVYLDDLGVLAAAVAFISNLARRRGILRPDGGARDVTTREGAERREITPPASVPDGRRGRR
jgi:uncharacterized membrane protein YkvA (DUF1232 family)